MLIWDYIRDFLVQYIFGGMDSNGDYFATKIGELHYDGGGEVLGDAYSLYHPCGYDFDNNLVYIDLADWLATTTTIIIMCLIVVLFALLVRWVFKTVVSAFLLR